MRWFELGLSPEALARSARRLARARAALDGAAEAHLAAHSRMDAAGFCRLDAEALAAAPEEIGLRALARVIGAVSGRDMPPRLAKLETLLAALKETPAKTHTMGGCRFEPLGQDLGVFRETRRTGLPVLPLCPGERALWDNRFRVALGALEPRAGHRAGAWRGGMARGAFQLAMACRTAALRRRHAARLLAWRSADVRAGTFRTRRNPRLRRELRQWREKR